ncbi:MAG: protein kinase [Planctomyces sp.]|nr:protein kinase [Planctomyces sp.]
MAAQVDAATPRSIFLAAIMLPDEQVRRSYLEQVCGDDRGLRRRVDDLIAACLSGDASPLKLVAEQLAGSQAANSDCEGETEVSATSRRCSTTGPRVDREPASNFDPATHPSIGPYKILELIGQGGMGSVYMAQQTVPIRRKVALKIIKPGMDSTDVIARFEAERQALAMMDHSNIARVLDGGTTTEGRPYFVMELVRGISLTEYCLQKKVGLDERLELFVDICRAVQHAHQKGIIHRDLKPSNILVTLHDGVPVIKVIDFGVAKALNHELTDRTLFTHFSQMIGTPLYMAPEQAEMSGLDIDTRSDIYSLGVILYELLTGTTPFDRDTINKLGFDGFRKALREQEPQRPSARVSTVRAASRSTLEDQRQLSTDDVSGKLQRELDWIVMKALEKNRDRRYETATAMADDVQRYLNGEQVLACPPTLGYRIAKCARRHRAMLVTGTLIAASLIVATGVSVAYAIQADAARVSANAAREESDQHLASEIEARREVDEQRRLAVEQRQLANVNLQKGVGIVDQMLKRVESEAFRSTPGTEAMRRELIQDGIQYYLAFLEQVPEDAELRLKAADAWTRVGDLHCLLGELTTGQNARQKAINILEKLHQDFPNELRFEVGLANAITQFGQWEHWRLFHFDRAELALRRGAELWQALAERFPEDKRYLSLAADTQSVLADTYKNLKRYDQAEEMLRHAIEKHRSFWPITDKPTLEHGRICNSLRILAMLIISDSARRDEAISLMKEAVECAEEIVSRDPESSDGYWALADAALHYGQLLESRGDTVRAEKAYRRAIEAGRNTPRVSPVQDLQNLHTVWRSNQALADLLLKKGEFAQAMALYLGARNLMKPAMTLPDLGGHFTGEITRLDNRVLSLIEKMVQGGQRDEAIRTCQQIDQHSGNESEVFVSKLFAAQAWAAAGDEQNSTRLLNDVRQRAELVIQDKPLLDDPERHAIYSAAIFRAGDICFHNNEHDNAFPLLHTAIELNPQNTEAIDHRGQIFMERGQYEAAAADFDETIVQNAQYSGNFLLRAYCRYRMGNEQGARNDLDIELQKDANSASTVYRSSLVLLALGDVGRSAELRDQILGTVTQSLNAETRVWAVLECAIVPAELAESASAIELAQSLLDENPGNQQHLFGLGAVQMRTGKYDVAAKTLSQAEEAIADPIVSRAYIRYFLAMTEHHLGHAEQARKHLNTANEIADAELEAFTPWNRRLTLELLRKETEALINVQ